MKEAIFILFAVMTVCAAGGVVLAQSAIYSAFNLILSLFGLAILYLMWGATFISMIQILVYAGAIVVLFVFVVMLLNLERPVQHFQNWLMITIAGIAGGLFSLFLLQALTRGTSQANPVEVPAPSIRLISNLLFTQYLWPFEVLTLFLLVLIVGIYLLARAESEGEAT